MFGSAGWLIFIIAGFLFLYSRAFRVKLQNDALLNFVYHFSKSVMISIGIYLIAASALLTAADGFAGAIGSFLLAILIACGLGLVFLISGLKDSKKRKDDNESKI